MQLNGCKTLIANVDSEWKLLGLNHGWLLSWITDRTDLQTRQWTPEQRKKELLQIVSTQRGRTLEDTLGRHTHIGERYCS